MFGARREGMPASQSYERDFRGQELLQGEIGAAVGGYPGLLALNTMQLGFAR